MTDVVDVPGTPDQIAYSPGNGLLFVPGGDDGITVLHEDSPDTYSVVQTITDPRLAGANAVVFDPTTHRIIVPHQGPRWPHLLRTIEASVGHRGPGRRRHGSQWVGASVRMASTLGDVGDVHDAPGGPCLP